MKIAILFEGNPKKPGGFYQSLQSASILNEITDDRFKLEFICLEKEAYNLLKKKEFKVKLFDNSFYKKIFNFFSNFNSSEQIGGGSYHNKKDLPKLLKNWEQNIYQTILKYKKLYK